MLCSQSNKQSTTQIKFPIRGCYYYHAKAAIDNGLLTKNSELLVKAEPDNAYDPYAMQVWLIVKTSPDTPLLIGYIPRLLSKKFSLYSQRQGSAPSLRICHLANKGRMIELDCQTELSLNCWQIMPLQLKALLSRWLTEIKRLWIRVQQQ